MAARLLRRPPCLCPLRLPSCRHTARFSRPFPLPLPPVLLPRLATTPAVHHRSCSRHLCCPAPLQPDSPPRPPLIISAPSSARERRRRCPITTPFSALFNQLWRLNHRHHRRIISTTSQLLSANLIITSCSSNSSSSSSSSSNEKECRPSKHICIMMRNQGLRRCLESAV